MTDRDGENEAKGFKGLQSLGIAKTGRPEPHPESAAPPQPTPRQEPSSPAPQDPRPDAQVPRSQTAPPAWRPWVIGLGVLAAFALVVAWIGSQPPGDTYSPAAVADSASDQSAAPTAEAVSEPTITAPPVGSGLILASDQIRYCVFEDRRIKAAEALVDNYNEYSVNTFNAMVEDYNSRCSNFRYRQGALAPIEAEANAVQTRLEQEGRQRMLGDQSSATSAAEVLPDPMTAAPSSSGPITEPYGASEMAGDSAFGASEGGVPPEEATSSQGADSVPAAADAAASDDSSGDSQEGTDGGDGGGLSAASDPQNLRLCLSGRYPSLCKRSLLTPAQQSQVAAAEGRQNLQTCLTGRYPSLCKRSLLSGSETVRVAEAERNENLRTCMSGNYPSLCKHALLSEGEAQQVLQSERRENLRTCLSGNYPSLCKRSMLTADESSQVDEAERRENLRICLSGSYPSLCKRTLLTDAQRLDVARMESSR